MGRSCPRSIRMGLHEPPECSPGSQHNLWTYVDVKRKGLVGPDSRKPKILGELTLPVVVNSTEHLRILL